MAYQELTVAPYRYFGALSKGDFKLGRSNTMAFTAYSIKNHYDDIKRRWSRLVMPGRKTFMFRVKPISFRSSESKITSTVLTKGGWEAFFQEQGGITDLSFSGTSGNIQETAGAVVHTPYGGGRAATSSMFFQDDYSQIDVRETVNWQKFWQMRAFWRTFHGDMGLWYCGVFYWGRLTGFNFEESGDNPFEIRYDFKFEAYPYSGFRDDPGYTNSVGAGSEIGPNVPTYTEFPISIPQQLQDTGRTKSATDRLPTNSPDEFMDNGKMYVGTGPFEAPFGNANFSGRRTRTINLKQIWAQTHSTIPRGTVTLQGNEVVGAKQFSIIRQRETGMTVQQIRRQLEGETGAQHLGVEAQANAVAKAFFPRL